METVGVIGLGKIGLRVADNLVKSDYRVVGYRRHAMMEFVSLGGEAADSPAHVAAAAAIVFSCLPSAQAPGAARPRPLGAFAARAGAGTAMRDRAAELFERRIDTGLGEHDVAVMVDMLPAFPRAGR